ncbi:hypothetical protein GCM10009105_07150 [Dokdonella soli]|uniref:Uncharacterized protein n=1 Tax=Dokdonella soli TaxID=529810 RepID=A0ABP3TM52_9GAMM
MRLKLDEQGHAVLQDGHPVYIHEDGKESPFNAAGTVATIQARNAEAKQHRERAETAESKLKAFEGIDDPAAAIKGRRLNSNSKTTYPAAPSRPRSATRPRHCLDVTACVPVSHRQMFRPSGKGLASEYRSQGIL